MAARLLQASWGGEDTVPKKMTKKHKEAEHAHPKWDLKPSGMDIGAYIKAVKISSEQSTLDTNQLKKCQRRKENKKKNH